MYVCKGDSCSFKKFWSDSMLGFWQCSSFLNRSTEAQNSLEWRTKQSPRSISELGIGLGVLKTQEVKGWQAS